MSPPAEPTPVECHAGVLRDPWVWFWSFVGWSGAGSSSSPHEPLRNPESRLDPSRFTRVHRSAIVNVECLKQLRRRTHGERVLVLDDGTELKLSRTHRDQLQLLLGHG